MFVIQIERVGRRTFFRWVASCRHSDALKKIVVLIQWICSHGLRLKDYGKVIAVMCMCAMTVSEPLAQGARVPEMQSPNTMEQSGPDVIRESVARWDINHDGIYTCQEWKIYMSRLFSLADKDRKAVIGPKNFDVIRRADPMFKDASFSYFDTNGDGQISLKEFVDAPSPFFVRYDKNGSCKVTATDIERKVARPEGGRGMPGGGGGMGGPPAGGPGQ